MDKYFRFKHFAVANELSSQKVGTDGVLLGAWVRLHGDEQHILDVGTGTGVIALMLAQRTDEALRVSAGGIAGREHFFASETRYQSIGAQSTTIIGIDIDAPSAEEAAANFKASPWAGRMAAFCGDFRGLGSDDSHPLKFLAFPYDLIVSNPPYFVDSLKAPDHRRSDARHSDSLPYSDLIEGALKNLAPDGRLAIILPSLEAERFESQACGAGLLPCRRCRVSTISGREPVRTLLELSRTAAICEESTLAIQDSAGYTDEYKALTKDFYLKF